MEPKGQDVDFATLTEAATAVLMTADPNAKAALSRAAAAAWRRGDLSAVGATRPPARPARPERPVLLAPARMPRRRSGGTPRSRIALLHALAHIELNAVDLAWDLVARFAAPDLPAGFYDDWVTVAADESRHFALLAERLASFGAAYGDLPAHDGLWQAAADTAHDLRARLAVVPMVLEARGLDVTPGMIARLRRFGDGDSARVLEIVYRDEIEHVAAGVRWFRWLCRRDGEDPAAAWRRLVRQHFRGALKPPFNAAGRAAADLPAQFYDPGAGAG